MEEGEDVIDLDVDGSDRSHFAVTLSSPLPTPFECYGAYHSILSFSGVARRFLFQPELLLVDSASLEIA